MAASVFGESDNIKHAVEAINELPQERLPAMLNRIATRILVVVCCHMQMTVFKMY
eukprot:m.8670 g.8670  ORF g.8670 m.8670 type:complete len:55 (+) comp9241_c0_seq1:2-166(+)